MKKKIKKYIGIGVILFSVWVLFPMDIIAKDPDYPTKPIEFIITYGIGGSTDVSCRALCEAAQKHFPQPIIPVNKPGASGIVGTNIIKNAKPDGYTIGVFTQSAAFIAPFTQEVQYDPLSDFTPIMHYGHYLYPLLIRADKPWKTWKDLIEWARKNPGGLKAGLTGTKYNQVQGITLSQIELKEKVKFTYIPFNSTPDMLRNLIGGNIDLFCSSVDPTNKEYIDMGKVRVISFLSKKKLPGYESIPSTFEMYGVANCNLMGVVGPKGLPSYVTKTLENAFAKGVKEPSFVSLMGKIYYDIIYMTGEEMGQYIMKTYNEYKEIIKQLKEDEAKK